MPDGGQLPIAVAGLDPEIEQFERQRCGGMLQEAPLATVATAAAEAVAADQQLPRLVTDPVGDAEVAAVQVEFQVGQLQHLADRQVARRWALAQKAREEQGGEQQRLTDLAAAAAAGIEPFEQGEGDLVPLVAGQQRFEQPGGLGLAQDLAAHGVAEQFQQFLADPCRRRLGDQRRAGIDPLAGGFVEGEVEPCGKFQGAQHAHRILGEAHQRIADHPQPAGFEVSQPTDVIDDAEAGDVVEQGVDGEVPPEGVLARGAEDVFRQQAMVIRILGKVVGGSQAPEGGYFHHRVRAEADMGQAETPANQKTVAEQPLDLLWRSVGAYVEVLGGASQQQVADPAADQIGEMPGPLQVVEHLEGVRVDPAARNAVRGARQDHRCRWLEKVGRWRQWHGWWCAPCGRPLGVPSFIAESRAAGKPLLQPGDSSRSGRKCARLRATD